MSTSSFPLANDRPIDFNASPDGSFDLVGLLLQQQNELTAVERFSRLHNFVERAVVSNADSSLRQGQPEQAKYYRALMPATPPTSDQQLAFEVDLDACSGCKACVVACHTLNGLEENESWRKVGTVTIGIPVEVSGESGTPIAIGIQHVTTACHHCEDPGCLNGCPVKAYDKDPITGIVRHLDDQCIGCKYCTMMCPYEVPRYSKRLGIVRKCDMCHQRLSVGEAPACVQACPNEAIRIRLVDRGQTFQPSDRLAPGAPLSAITRPTTIYKSRTSGRTGTPHDAGVDEVAESHWPLAALLIGTQLSVGMILVERLVAMTLSLMGLTTEPMVTLATATAALAAGGIGLNLAPLHLGQPLRAWRVFLGLRTSWLSREAVILGAYMGVLLGAVALMSLPIVSPWLPAFVVTMASDWIPWWAASATLWLALPIGLAGLFCSGMIYVATQREVWRWSRTMIRCSGTTLVAGALSYLTVVLGVAWQRQGSAGAWGGVLEIVGGGALMLLVAKLVWEYRTHWGPARSTDSDHEARSRRLVDERLSALRNLRIVAGVAAAIGLMTILLASLASGVGVVALGVLMMASVLVVVGESSERLLYFMSVVTDRMPGTLR